MPSPQFNKKITTNRWYTLTYQSTRALNDAEHHQVKRKIAEILVNNFTIQEIHSYVHSNIVFAINTNVESQVFDEIVQNLNAPLINYVPRLHFNIALVAKNDSNVNFMYIDGIDSMNSNFLASISDIFPYNRHSNLVRH